MKARLPVSPVLFAALAAAGPEAGAQVEVTVIGGREVARSEFVFDAHPEPHFNANNFTFVQPLDGGLAILEPDPPPAQGFGLLTFFVPSLAPPAPVAPNVTLPTVPDLPSGPILPGAASRDAPLNPVIVPDLDQAGDPFAPGAPFTSNGIDLISAFTYRRRAGSEWSPYLNADCGEGAGLACDGGYGEAGGSNRRPRYGGYELDLGCGCDGDGSGPACGGGAAAAMRSSASTRARRARPRRLRHATRHWSRPGRVWRGPRPSTAVSSARPEPGSISTFSCAAIDALRCSTRASPTGRPRSTRSPRASGAR